MTTKDSKWTTVETDFFKFETVNDSLEGVLIEKSTQPFGETIVGRYKLSQEGDKIVTFLGNTSLDDKLESVAIGTEIRLTWVGTINTGNNRKMKDMKLEIAS